MHSSASHFKPVLHKNDTNPKSNDISLKKILAQAGKITKMIVYEDTLEK